MSRYYSMSVSITDYQADRADAICKAASEEWNFDDWYTSKDELLSSSGDSSLCGGESEDDFSQRLAHAIWKANNRFCTVVVGCTYLEDLPYEEYGFDNDAYQQFLNNQK